MSTAIVRPVEERRKEVKIGKPYVEYLTIGLLGAFGLFICLLLIAVIVVTPIFMQYPYDRDEFCIAKVEGNSMYPTIKDGNYVLILKKDVPDFNISIGDIVVFYDNETNKYVSHRVIDINGETIITKGDNNMFFDDEITYSQVRGKVVKIIEYRIERWCYEALLSLFNWW